MSACEYIFRFNMNTSTITEVDGVTTVRMGTELHERIVRCRDCKFGVDGGEYCAEDCADSWDWRCVEPDGFCAWGERKADA